MILKIVERSYQTEVIRRITENFDQQKSRKALLVMATGTGKTRTAIATIFCTPKRITWEMTD